VPPLRTAHWHSDEVFELTWPEEWSVSVRWPETPPPLSPSQIIEALRHPVGGRTVADLCRGRRRPLIIIDDVSRPTPTAQILDRLLDEVQAVGIAPAAVTILMATGTHPVPSQDATVRKVGARAAGACRVVIHEDGRNCVRVGRTSHRTPIVVDREVLEADCIIGIGGIYPNQTAGFGGGSKLALGVLGRESITHLHEKHRSAGWGRSDPSLTFRRDLDEIASQIGLAALVTVHIDGETRPIRVVFGDHRAYYADEARWAAATYRVPGPGDADVVVANAYPNDGTLVAAYQKGLDPLRHCRPDASRVLIASCFMGPGGHGLYPLVNPPNLARRISRKASVMTPSRFMAAIFHGVRHRLEPGGVPFQWPIVLHRPGSAPKPELPRVGGLDFVSSWESVITTIRTQHPDERHLRVVVYPCASLQWIDGSPSPSAVSQATSRAAPKESQR
jgi:nickel-dependent lactate racemase